MSLVRFNPYRGLASLSDDVERFFRGYDIDPETFDTVWVPSVDVAENEKAYEVKAEIPGMKKEDIKVNLENDVLTIQGEKKEETDKKEKNVQLSERVYGRFQRSFRLPKQTKSEAIKATYKDGVLTLEIPKAEETKPAAIPIE
jgi:HSP20 family protein